jgi:acylglycerol lipase
MTSSTIIVATSKIMRPERMRRVRCLLAMLFIAGLGLAACAPRLQPPGPRPETARLEPGYLVTPDGLYLPLRVWQPPGKVRAALIALHGFNDYSKAFDALGPALAARGVAVYAYDQRGFGNAPYRGLWPGTERLTKDLATAAELVRAAHPGVPLHALGESMGGAVIMAALSGKTPPKVDGAILSAPAVWGRATISPLQVAALDTLVRIAPGVRLRPQGMSIRASDNTEMLRALGRDRWFIKETRIDALWGLVNLMDRALAAAPNLNHQLLVLYGEQDEIIPRQSTCRMLASLPASPRRWRVVLYEDGFHMLFRDLRGDRVTADIAAWTLNQSAKLPSSQERAPTDKSPLPGFC